MNIEDLSDKASNAAILAILREVEKSIKALEMDASVVAPGHLVGYLSGWKAAKHAIIDLLETT